jgi:hypothetical protein
MLHAKVNLQALANNRVGSIDRQAGVEPAAARMPIMLARETPQKRA